MYRAGDTRLDGVLHVAPKNPGFNCGILVGQNKGVNQTPAQPESLVKSKQRVADHGEVFTPSWMVEDMLNLVKDESERIDARFLEPACGDGNFLKVVLQRKLVTVKCIYGIELLADNVQECRENLLDVFAKYLKVDSESVWYQAAKVVLAANVIHGDALTLKTPENEPINFPEWGYLGAGKFQRRDFRYDSLTQRSSIEGSLFEFLEEHEVFIPTKTHPPMTVQEIAQ
jgi:hypothetical protein